MVDTEILTIGPVLGIWHILNFESPLPASEWLATGIHKPVKNNPKCLIQWDLQNAKKNTTETVFSYDT